MEMVLTAVFEEVSESEVLRSGGLGACGGCASVNCTADVSQHVVLWLTRCSGGSNGATLRNSFSRSGSFLALASVLVCKDGRVLAVRISVGGFSCTE